MVKPNDSANSWTFLALGGTGPVGILLSLAFRSRRAVPERRAAF